MFRYVIIENAPLADFFWDLVQQVSQFSLKLQSDMTFHETPDKSPYQGSLPVEFDSLGRPLRVTSHCFSQALSVSTKETLRSLLNSCGKGTLSTHALTDSISVMTPRESIPLCFRYYKWVLLEFAMMRGWLKVRLQPNLLRWIVIDFYHACRSIQSSSKGVAGVDGHWVL